MLKVKKPSGIFYGWWIVAASIILYTFIGGAGVYGFSAFFQPITLEMGWSKAQTALAFSLRSVEGGLTQPIIGFLIDRFGSRRCIFTGILIIAFAFFLLSRTSSLLSFYVAILALALGMSAAVSLAEYAAVANWFRRRRSLALGLLSAGYGFSGVMTPVLVYLINTYTWRGSAARLSTAVLFLGIPLSFVIRHRPEPHGYLPDGDRSENCTVRESRTLNNGEIVLTRPEEFTVRECLRSSTFWFLTLFYFFVGFAQSAIIVHEMPYLTGIGISENVAAYTMFGITASSLVGRIGFAWLGDTYDKKKLLLLATAMEAAGVFIFANIKSPWMIVPFLALYGPGFGAPIPLIAAIQADCFGTRAFGATRGIMALGYSTSGIIAPVLAGWVADTRGSYYLAFMIYAGLCSLAVPTVMAARVTPRRVPAAPVQTPAR